MTTGPDPSLKAAPKKKAKRRPAYKLVQRPGGGMGAVVADAFSEIESLAEEMREMHSNMDDNGLGATSKCEAAGEAADALEQVSAVDVPEFLDELVVDYSESVNTRKGRGPSRAVRLGNAISMLQAAVEIATDKDLVGDDANARDEFVNELENAISEVEGVDFPGMYG